MVLGELHSCVNTVNALLFLDTAPNAPEIRGWIDREIAGAIAPLYPFSTGHVNSRTAPPGAHLSPLCRYIGIGSEPSYHPRSAELIPITSLRVVPAGDGFRVVSVDGTFEEDLVQVLGDYLSSAAVQSFGFLERRDHQPRITIDDVVVCRETWRVPFTDLPGPDAKEEPVHAFFQALRERLGVPQNVFVRVMRRGETGLRRPGQPLAGRHALVEDPSRTRAGARRRPGVLRDAPGPGRNVVQGRCRTAVSRRIQDRVHRQEEP